MIHFSAGTDGFLAAAVLKGLLTTFKTAYVLFLLIFMFALKMFLQA